MSAPPPLTVMEPSEFVTALPARLGEPMSESANELDGGVVTGGVTGVIGVIGSIGTTGACICNGTTSIPETIALSLTVVKTRFNVPSETSTGKTGLYAACRPTVAKRSRLVMICCPSAETSKSRELVVVTRDSQKRRVTLYAPAATGML